MTNNAKQAQKPQPDCPGMTDRHDLWQIMAAAIDRPEDVLKLYKISLKCNCLGILSKKHKSEIMEIFPTPNLFKL